MNILYVSYDGMTDTLGQSQVIPYLTGISGLGNSITILSCEKKEKYDLNREYIHNMLSVNKINWAPLCYTANPPVISTLIDIIKLRIKAEKLHKKNKFDIIHCRSYIASLIGLYLKRKYGIKFIFDMRGFWANERVEGKIWNLKNPIYKLIYKYFKGKEKTFLNNADYVISLTNNAKKEIHTWDSIPNQPVPIEVIPCCTDSRLFSADNIDTERQQQYKAELKISKNDFIISYEGSIGTWYMLDEMLVFFKHLKLKFKNARFLFITFDDENIILKKADIYGIDRHDIIITKADRNEMPCLLSLSDIAVFFIKPVYSKKASSPTKQGEIMNMGIPIICNSRVGDTDIIIKESKAGVLIDHFNEFEYDMAVDKIKELSLIPKDTIRNYALKYFDLEKGIKSYIYVYNQVMKTQ